MGGALADISWLEAGDIPIVSFHCEKDEYAPIDTGDVIVPTTGDFVVEVMGSRTVQHYSNQYGNNDVFINAGFTDAITNQANINNSGYEGLYVFKTPPLLQLQMLMVNWRKNKEVHGIGGIIQLMGF